MSTNVKTDHTKCTFTVKEYADGEPWIMVEFYEPGIPALRDGFLSIRFRGRVPIKEAERIAGELRDNFEGIGYTHFGG